LTQKDKNTEKKTVKKKVSKSTKKTSKKTVSKKTVQKAASKKSSSGKASSLKEAIEKNKSGKKLQSTIRQTEERSITETVPSADDSSMTVVEHLDEMRSRVIWVLLSIIIFTIIGFVFSDQIVNFINKPFLETGKKLNVFKLTGGFIIKLKASVGTALVISLPLILFQIWRFISPAIDKSNRMFARMSLLFAVVLFYSGAAFVFFLLMPFAITMLLDFIPPEMISTIGADDYLSFIFLFSIAMGVLFELPIIILVLTKIGIITPLFLITKRKYAIVAIWVIAALITPADPLSQILVAVPLMFLYEISILLSKMVVKRSLKKNKQ